MRKEIKKGVWVEIKSTILKAEERAAHIPSDTKNIPLELTARGFLQHAAFMGDQVTIKTLIGRQLTGVLIEHNPGYEHTFGPPIMQLLPIGQELRLLLKEDSDQL